MKLVYKFYFLLFLIVFNLYLTMKINSPKINYRLQEYLTYNSLDKRQINLNKKLRTESFFKNISNQTEDLHYKYLNYEQIHNSFKSLSDKYPNLILTYSAQKKFKLPYPEGVCGLEGHI